MLILRTWKAKLLIALPIAGLIALVCLYAGLRYSETPKFCITCHNMQPYYDAWEKSVHKEVNCVKCHYEPGVKAHIKGKIGGFVQLIQYITGFYGEKPNAQISDATCLKGGCHEKQSLKDKKITYKETVEFDHTPHFEDLEGVGKLRCTTCHSQVTHNEHIEIGEFACFTCHFKDVKPGTGTADCRLCHTSPESHKGYLEGMKDSSESCLMCHTDIIEGKGDVPRMRCYSCHADSAHIDKYTDKEFIHRNHVTDHKVECFECHNEIKHSFD